jgi:hypothetical protein
LVFHRLSAAYSGEHYLNLQHSRSAASTASAAGCGG